MYRRPFLALGGALRSPPRLLKTLVLLIPVILSCGIETYPYLNPVPSGNITSSINEQATIILPGVGSNSSVAFSHFALYYRIYVSYSNRTGFALSANDLRDINSTLYSDYNSLSSYTSTSNTTTVNIASVMTNRGYQPLYFGTSGNNSPDVLGSPGIQVQLHFPQRFDLNEPPYLGLPGNTKVNLIRSNGGGTFSPLPAHRYFLNTDELNRDGNISTTANADVAGPSGAGNIRHAYVAIYIATAGINLQTYTPAFSIPSFVGIFKLANQ
ncbi:MAG: hypothetical protein LBU19_02750 [Treponema sp.]|nr:hypothetical protein [Treponema sp.]